jgi:hypothetical protein
MACLRAQALNDKARGARDQPAIEVATTARLGADHHLDGAALVEGLDRGLRERGRGDEQRDDGKRTHDGPPDRGRTIAQLSGARNRRGLRLMVTARFLNGAYPFRKTGAHPRIKSEGRLFRDMR